MASSKRAKVSGGVLSFEKQFIQIPGIQPFNLWECLPIILVGDNAQFQLILNPLPWPHFPIIYLLLKIPKTKKD